MCIRDRPERILTPADYYTTPQGTYAVRCQLIEKDTAIMDLTMAAPNKAAARAICKSWPQKCQDIYTTIMLSLIHICAMPGIKAFVAAVFGGIGSIPGAMVGGILLGIIEIFGKAYILSLIHI